MVSLQKLLLTVHAVVSKKEANWQIGLLGFASFENYDIFLAFIKMQLLFSPFFNGCLLHRKSEYPSKLEYPHHDGHFIGLST